MLMNHKRTIIFKYWQVVMVLDYEVGLPTPTRYCNVFRHEHQHSLFPVSEQSCKSVRGLTLSHTRQQRMRSSIGIPLIITRMCVNYFQLVADRCELKSCGNSRGSEIMRYIAPFCNKARRFCLSWILSRCKHTHCSNSGYRLNENSSRIQRNVVTHPFWMTPIYLSFYFCLPHSTSIAQLPCPSITV